MSKLTQHWKKIILAVIGSLIFGGLVVHCTLDSSISFPMITIEPWLGQDKNTPFISLEEGGLKIGTNTIRISRFRLDMGGLKIVNLADPTADQDAVTKAYVDTLVPPGTIVMYSGAWNFDETGLGTGPLEGWALCNGNNGTPNLTDRFVMGTNTSGNLGTTGGTNSYSLTVSQLPSHTHSISSDGNHSHTLYRRTGWDGSTCLAVEFYRAACSWTSGWTGQAGAHNHGGATGATGGGAPIDNRPAFLQLAFIMKL